MTMYDCSKCHAASDVDCENRESWTCNICGQVNKIKKGDEEADGDNWVREEGLSGMCDYVGPESDLPSGGNSLIEGWFPQKAAQRWIVSAPEIDEGILEKKTNELTGNDLIIGVRLNTNTLNRLEQSYGPRFFMIKDANGHQMTPREWEAKYHTSGLGLVAIRNMRRILKGFAGGVTCGF